MDFDRNATHTGGEHEGDEWEMTFPDPKVWELYLPLYHASYPYIIFTTSGGGRGTSPRDLGGRKDEGLERRYRKR